MGVEFRCPIDGKVCKRIKCVESNAAKDLLPCDTAAAGIAFRVIGASAIEDATGKAVDENQYATEAAQAALALGKSPREFVKRVEFFIEHSDQNPLK